MIIIFIEHNLIKGWGYRKVSEIPPDKKQYMLTGNPLQIILPLLPHNLAQPERTIRCPVELVTLDSVDLGVRPGE